MPRIKSKYAVDSTGLSEKVKSLRLDKDENGDLPALPVIPFNVYANPSTAVMPIHILDDATYTRMASVVPLNGYVHLAYGGNYLQVGAVQNVVNMADLTFDVVRTPTIFKSVQVDTAAATAVWTPTTGKKFRLMGGVITFEAPTLGAAAATTITFLDEAASITLAFGAFIPAAASGVAVPIGFDLKPNGYLSAAANNVLNATLTANLTGGKIRITVWGTEE